MLYYRKFCKYNIVLLYYHKYCKCNIINWDNIIYDIGNARAIWDIIIILYPDKIFLISSYTVGCTNSSKFWFFIKSLTEFVMLI